MIKLEGKEPKTKPNKVKPISSTNDVKITKSKLVHKEYTGTSIKIRKYLGYNHKEPARYQYYFRLVDLDNFVNNTYNMGVDEVLTRLESKKFYVINNKMKVAVDQYDLMCSYLNYLTNKRKKDGNKLSPSTIHHHMITAKIFIETETEIEFKDKRYENKVKLPQIMKGTKLPLPRETILKLINGCTHPNQQRLRMILLLLSACGSRIGESLLLRLSDLHLDGLPYFGTAPPYYPYIYFRAEITKIGKSRTTLLTNEIAEQLKLWIKGRYATRNRTSFDTNVGKYKTVKHTPEKNLNDFVFLDINNSYKEKDAAHYAYNDVLQRFHELLEDLELNHKSSNGQRAITLHKIRSSVRTAISNLVTDKEFPDYYIGHDVDTYYNPTPEQYKEQFRLCQSALTYLDQSAIIKSYGGIETRIDKIEEKELATLRNQILVMQQEKQADREEMRQMKEMFATIYNNKHTITLNAANGESVLYSSDRLPPDGVSMDNFKPVVHMNKDGKIKPIKK